MRDGIACYIFGTIDLIEAASIVTGLTEKLILLVVGAFTENTHPVISGPAKEKVFIGVDSCPFFIGLLKRSIVLHIFLERSLEIYLLGGTGRHQYNGHPEI